MQKRLAVYAGLVVLAACGSGADTGNGQNYFSPMVQPEDFAVLTGDNWTGELTYLNYSEPQEEITIPAKLAVAQNNNTFELYISYPDEPRADGRAELTISDDGRMINDEKVISREKENGALVLKSEQACEDNGATATCEYTYMIDEDAFSLRKMVTLDGEDAAFQRNLYEFSR